MADFIVGVMAVAVVAAAFAGYLAGRMNRDREWNSLIANGYFPAPHRTWKGRFNNAQ